MAFTLMKNGAPLAAAGWEQIRHPDRYAGTEYLSSAALDLSPLPDGSLRAVARVPGRYRLAARSGTERIETCVLVRPSQVAPAIRGAAFFANAPLDAAYAHATLGKAKAAGMTWADVVESAYVDFDRDEIVFDLDCGWCPLFGGRIAADRLGPLLDDARQQGFNVVLELALMARWQGKIYELGDVLTRAQSPWLDFPSTGSRSASLPPPTNPAIRPDVLRAFATLIDRVAVLAATHQVAALEFNDPLDLGETVSASHVREWNAIIAGVHRTFPGELWTASASTCGEPDSASWMESDTIQANVAFLIAAAAMTPHCRGAVDERSDLDADALAARFAAVDDLHPFRAQDASHKTLILRDLYTRHVDGVSYLGPAVLGAKRSRDDQELVDTFEALMRTVMQRPGVGFFLWAVQLTNDPFGEISDPLQDPALAAAIANWWSP